MLYLYLFYVGIVHVSSLTNYLDYEGLFLLYKSTLGPSWSYTLNGTKWNFTDGSDPCADNWQGISCDANSTICSFVDSNCTVTNIYLEDQNLRGTLPVSMFTDRLLNLTGLYLSTNFISGEIPTSLWSVSQLRIVDLSSNSFFGWIINGDSNPYIPLPNIESISLDLNFLYGSIPAAFLCNAPHLSQISLSDNFLSGEMPPGCYLNSPDYIPVYNASSLAFINLKFNFFTGSLPSILTMLPSLTYLYVGVNSFSGSIPASFNRELVYLALNTNYLTGNFPSGLILCSGMRYIAADQNSLSGPIPNYLGTFSKLTKLYLYQNSLTGTIPAALSGLIAIQNLFLGSNILTGTIPASLFSGCTALVELSLVNSYLTGTLPPTIHNVQKLQRLHLGENFLSGSLPLQLSLCSNLYYLIIYTNLFTSSIPNLMIFSFPDLVYMLMDTNLFTGTIPNEFFGKTQFQEFSIYSNSFTGSIPSSMSALTALQLLLMSENYFTGRPVDVIYSSNKTSGAPLFYNLLSLDISNNEFTGSIPYELLSLSSIQSLAMVGNCFSGTLTDLICSSNTVRVLAMDGLNTSPRCRFKLFNSYFPKNELHGSIPSCLWALTNLATFHLSGNLLSGTLSGTEALYNNMDASNLVNLTISYNRLSGVIPDALQTWTKFLNFDLSYNRFGGTVDHMGDLVNDHRVCLEYEQYNGINNCTKVTVTSNRLSGNLPAAFTEAVYIDILWGNLFDCSQQSIPRHDPKSSQYICGSFAFNVSIYLWTAFVGLLVCLLAIIYYRHVYIMKPYTASVPRSRNPSVDTAQSDVISLWTNIKTGYYAQLLLRWHSAATMLSNCQLEQVSKFLKLMNHLRNTCVITFLAIATVITPMYLVLKYYGYATHTYQYSWLSSIAMLNGIKPAWIIAIGWFVVISLFGVVTIMVYGRNRSKRSFIEGLSASERLIQKHSDEINYSEKLTFVGELKRMLKNWELSRGKKMFLLCSLCFFFDLLVVIPMKLAYITVLSSDFSYRLVIACQFGFAVLDLLWNWTVVPHIVNSLRYVFFFSQNTTVIIKSSMFLVNCVILPSLVIMIDDINCFYQLFIEPPAKVTSNFDVSFCYTLDVTNPGGCSSIDYMTIYTYFTPPWVYNYQCSTSLIVDYVPIFVFTYTAVGFILPIFFLALAFMDPEKLPDWIVRRLPGILWPSYAIDRLPSDFVAQAILESLQLSLYEKSENSGAELESKDFGPYSDQTVASEIINNPEALDISGVEMRLTVTNPLNREEVQVAQGRTLSSIRASLKRGFRLRILKPDVITASCINHFIILLTFGLACPLLGLVITLSMIITVLFWQLMVGRFALYVNSICKDRCYLLYLQHGVSQEEINDNMTDFDEFASQDSFYTRPSSFKKGKKQQLLLKEELIEAHKEKSNPRLQFETAGIPRGLALLLMPLEREVHGAWRGTATSERLIILTSAVFVGLILVDISSADLDNSPVILFFPLSMTLFAFLAFRRRGLVYWLYQKLYA